MVFSATFNTISVISWRLVLLVDEIRENQQPNKLKVVLSAPSLVRDTNSKL